MGTGVVGQTLATKLVELGHQVKMGARAADSENADVVGLLGELGWPAESILDPGGIEAARGTEMYLALWIRIMGALGTPSFNIAVVRG